MLETIKKSWNECIDNMKKLIIVRHAKSSWENGLSDKDRPLVSKGIERANEHARMLKSQLKDFPKMWVSSHALRALHTAVIFGREFDKLEDIKIQKSLYTFSAKDLMQVIREFSDHVDSVIIFAHNEACLQAISAYTGKYIVEFKTASVAFIEFNQSHWKNIKEGNLKFTISKEEIQ